ncbi:MAG: M24 family metallopeptidase [Acidobacteria bacterium]|nr:M24 family metallopeptidase [Acidobacteriota bacterium]
MIDGFPGMQLLDASRVLLTLRKKKEKDEIASVKESLKYCAVGCQVARNTIAPRLTEIDVCNAMQSVITRAAGTNISLRVILPAERGAPASRKIQNGGLYILNIFPAVDLCFADTCCTFAGGGLTDLQQEGWQLVMDALRLAESLVKPEASARSSFQRCKRVFGFSSSPLLIKSLGFTLCMALLPAGVSADAGRFLVFHKQARKAIPKLSIGLQTYLPVVDLLHVLELPYSESASAGFVQITMGKNRLRLAKDEPQLVLNDRKIILSAPVTVVKNQWVVPLEFFSKVLDSALDVKISVAASGNAASVGESDFTQLNAKIETNRVLRLQASRPISAEVRQQGSRVVLAFGNTLVDFVGSEGVQRVEWIRSLALDQSESTNQLVIELADGVRNAKISHLASQNAYTVEAVRQEAAEATSGASAEVARPVTEAWKWRHITVDAGHGGPDRGVAIKEHVFEKDVALAIARKLRWALETRLGVTVVLSRAEDQPQGLDDRIAAANLARSNLFISIHAGSAAASPAAHSYAYTARWIADESSASETRNVRSLFVPWWEAQRNNLAWSERLAECVQSEMNRALNGGQPLAFRRSPIKLLSALAMPAVLVEIGNAQVPEFQAKVESEPFQNLVAATLAAAVEKFRPIHERP